jgi:hypothetical protein
MSGRMCNAETALDKVFAPAGVGHATLFRPRYPANESVTTP